MKKNIRLLIVTALILSLFVCAPAAQAAVLSLPDDSSVFDPDTAQSLLELCTGHTADGTKAAFEKYGIPILGQYRYDKPDSDTSHTCAYTIGSTTALLNGSERNVILIVLRGTNGGEWASNCDICPSRDFDTPWADNFMLCAEDAYSALLPVLQGENDPVVVVAGHSRGAAAANLLTVLLDRELPLGSVYGYTFACPGTVLVPSDETSVPNLFNLINPADVVTRLPLAEWGFTRAGQDIVLTASQDEIASIDQSMQYLATLAPDVRSYYELSWSLTSAGPGEGLTAYQLMDMFTSAFSGTPLPQNGGAFAQLSPESSLAPFVGMFSQDETTMQRLLMRHMPSTYATLIDLCCW